MDAKIGSKAMALRTINDAIRTIDDVLEHTENNDEDDDEEEEEDDNNDEDDDDD